MEQEKATYKYGQLQVSESRIKPPVKSSLLRILFALIAISCMGHRRKSFQGFQGLLLQFHVALGAFTAILIAVLQLMYQNRSVSPFEEYSRCMYAFLGFLSLHLTGVIAAVMVRRSGTRGRRGLTAAVTLSHLGFISGLFASASILFLLLPASVCSVLMASCSVIILTAAPCKPAGLFYSKLQQYFSPGAVNQGEQADDATTPDLENSVGLELASIHGPNQDAPDDAITPDLENNVGLELSSIHGPNQDAPTVNSRLD